MFYEVLLNSNAYVTWKTMSENVPFCNNEATFSEPFIGESMNNPFFSGSIHQSLMNPLWLFGVGWLHLICSKTHFCQHWMASQNGRQPFVRYYICSPPEILIQDDAQINHRRVTK